MPNYGSTIQTNARFRKAPAMTPEVVETVERELREFDMFDLWLEPRANNVQQLGRALQILDRTGNWVAETTDAGITIGTGFTAGLATINLPGDAASAANELPLNVPGYFLPGSYTVVMVLEFIAGANLNQAAQFFSAGVQDGGDVEAFLLNNAVYMRHTDLSSQTGSPRFVANERALCWWSYDAALGLRAFGKNSVVPTAWAAGLDNLGANQSGETRQLVIGGKFNPAASAGTQLLAAKLRSVFASRESWLAPEMSAYRTAFLAKLASRHPSSDFTMA